MKNILVIFRRELRSYFATPLAYVFIVIFLVLAAVFTFQVGGLFERGQADLQPFFRWHPWLYLVLIPAISMRLWAEERNSGSIELLMTMPITLTQAVAGKFLAEKVGCQSASDRDPGSASKRDPPFLRFERLALAPSELVGVAETGRARVGV